MSNFIVTKTRISDLYEIWPKVYEDERGYFMETYQYKAFAKAGLDMEFCQDNHSKSKKGVLRGLHFQKNKPQGKLVRVIQGEVFDVAVDIRPNSLNFGEWYGVLLSEENKKMLYIPPGFAHGFYVLSSKAELVYKCSNYYDPKDEQGIIWNDPSIDIKWPLIDANPIISDKDKEHPSFKELFENKKKSKL